MSPVSLLPRSTYAGGSHFPLEPRFTMLYIIFEAKALVREDRSVRGDISKKGAFCGEIWRRSEKLRHGFTEADAREHW